MLGTRVICRPWTIVAVIAVGGSAKDSDLLWRMKSALVLNLLLLGAVGYGPALSYGPQCCGLLETVVCHGRDPCRSNGELLDNSSLRIPSTSLGNHRT